MKKRTWILGGYVVAFLLGAIGGAAIVEGRAAERQTALLGKATRRYEAYMWTLDRRLRLTAAESDAIEAILERYEPRRHALLVPVEQDLQLLRSTMRDEIRDSLEPQKRTEFEALMREHDEMRGRHPEPSTSAGATLPGVAGPTRVLPK